MTPNEWRIAVDAMAKAQANTATRELRTALNRARLAIPGEETLASMEPGEAATAIRTGLIRVRFAEGLDSAGHRIYARALLGVGRLVSTMVTYEPSLESPRSVKVLADGGTRLAQLDVATHSRVSSTIAALRAEGAHPSVIARRLRRIVPAGSWSSSKVRAQVISRTEVRYAQNVASLSIAGDVGIGMVKVLDGQLPTSDDDCIARNGLEVTLEEANTLLGLEHPNGTMDFVPVVR